jgi:Arc/MetJ family transcription regulator
VRTSIVIDDGLIRSAMRATGLKTKKAVVEEGLKLLVRLKQQQAIRRWRGKLRWEGDLDAMQTDVGRPLSRSCRALRPTRRRPPPGRP